MAKYVYNRHTGHFTLKLNEDDTQNVATDTAQQSTDTSTNNQSTSFKSVEQDETIQDLNAKITELGSKYKNDLNTQQKLLDAAKVNASKKEQTGVYDPVATDATVLNISKKINDIKKQYANDLWRLEDQKISQLQKLSQANESYYNLPEKYKGLNESNIHTAKIYMKNLVGDDNAILKGMADFKRAFKDTDLLYGKDRTGYFIIALDSEDFNKATDTLEEVGYLRDEVLDTIMPQLLDRHQMIQ